MENLLPDNVMQKYITAGKIASKVRDFAQSLVHEGMPIIELCSKIESKIVESGGKPAFPCNVSINEIAAHYTSPPFDSATIPKKAVVKVDIGIHIDGYIADTATTISLDPTYIPLVEAAEEALNNACKAMRSGVKVSDVGKIIQSTLNNRGLKPIRNLQGHKVARFSIHAGKSIPNVPDFNGSRLETGEVYAVEPFVTVGSAAGEVMNLKDSFIYRYVRDTHPRDENASILLKRIKSDFRTLPFTMRWVYDLLPPTEIDKAFSSLLSQKAIVGYPVLIEASGNVVSQAEHTVVITEKDCVPITL